MSVVITNADLNFQNVGGGSKNGQLSTGYDQSSQDIEPIAHTYRYTPYIHTYIHTYIFFNLHTYKHRYLFTYVHVKVNNIITFK